MDNWRDLGDPDAISSTADSDGLSGIEYRRLRSPKNHGETLQIPSLSHIDALWNGNLRIRSNASNVRIADTCLSDLQRLGRSELLRLAQAYTGSYRSVGKVTDSDAIVMAGHQPELFHPGVWYKNFVLSDLGNRFGCTAINLVVDNDQCGKASVGVPRVNSTIGPGELIVGTVDVDRPGNVVPFEERPIQDRAYFEQFPGRVNEAIKHWVPNPIVNRLWPEVLCAAERFNGDHPSPRLGQVIAAGRHRLEAQFGLQTLEIPISRVAQSEAFAVFVQSVLTEPTRFRSIYNDVLIEYRDVHRIRSNAHPVPELESREGWSESPFWVWTKRQPTRMRLYVKRLDQSICLSDLVGWEQRIELSNFPEAFRNLVNGTVAIRPRALMTTLFSRMVLSDLFLHGIGGAKYDQLTDAIAARFYSTQLPAFLTLSATMRLPVDRKIVTHADVTAIERLIREHRFHPENHLSNPPQSVRDWVQEKREWTQGEHRGERSRKKHNAIEAINRELASLVEGQRQSLEAERKHALSQIRAGQILGSREYSFCLFPETLVDELKRCVHLP